MLSEFVPARVRLAWLAPVLLISVGCGARAPTVVVPPSATPAVSLATAPDGTHVFEATGLDPAALAAWCAGNPDEARWQSVFAVEVGNEATRLRGSYEAEGDTIRFRPRYPVLASIGYRAVLHPNALPGAPAGAPPVVAAVLKLPRPEGLPPAAVVGVYPTADVLPENLLKIYVHFSAPMQRGDAYRFIRLLDEQGRPVELPFLEIAEELWDPAGKRLTLLLDPGRVKQGLKPREEEGPVLQSGQRYTLVIDPRARSAGGGFEGIWSDAYGQPLQSTYQKSFRAAAAEARPIDLADWKLTAPAANTRDPLTVLFPRPLDHALLRRVVRVVAADGTALPGDIELAGQETCWKFTPRTAWAAADYHLEVETILEDLAGNSVGRSFEVDQSRPDLDAGTPVKRLTFTVRAPGPRSGGI